MRRFRKPLLFSLAVLPIAVIAAFFTCLYQFEMYPAEVVEETAAQLGSVGMVVVISVIQTAIYVLPCCFFGYILADKTGLWKPIAFEKEKVVRTLLISAVIGILFSLDYWTFGAVIPGIREAADAGMTLYGVIASVLYGGIVEEIMLRLFVLSLIAFLIWKLFFRKYGREHIPTGVFVTGNITAALLFAAGHLPATLLTFGELTPLILFRCFLLNGGFGLVFGRIYRKYGLGYAMLSHACVHCVSKLIWFVFI